MAVFEDEFDKVFESIFGNGDAVAQVRLNVMKSERGYMLYFFCSGNVSHREQIAGKALLLRLSLSGVLDFLP